MDTPALYLLVAKIMPEHSNSLSPECKRVDADLFAESSMRVRCQHCHQGLCNAPLSSEALIPPSPAPSDAQPATFCALSSSEAAWRQPRRVLARDDAWTRGVHLRTYLYVATTARPSDAGPVIEFRGIFSKLNERCPHPKALNFRFEPLVCTRALLRRCCTRRPGGCRRFVDFGPCP